MASLDDDGYEAHRERAVNAASAGMPPAGAMLSSGVPLELMDRMRKGYASERVYRDRIDELLHAAWAYVRRMYHEVDLIRLDPDYATFSGRPIALEMKRARDIRMDLQALCEELTAEQKELTGLAGMDESVISISLIKKRSSLHSVDGEEVGDG